MPIIKYDDGLYIAGLPGGDTDAGLTAARQVFSKYGVTANECHREILRFAADELYNYILCGIWFEAESAAISAASQGWINVPEAARLECYS